MSPSNRMLNPRDDEMKKKLLDILNREDPRKLLPFYAGIDAKGDNKIIDFDLSSCVLYFYFYDEIESETHKCGYVYRFLLIGLHEVFLRFDCFYSGVEMIPIEFYEVTQELTWKRIYTDYTSDANMEASTTTQGRSYDDYYDYDSYGSSYDDS